MGKEQRDVSYLEEKLRNPPRSIEELQSVWDAWMELRDDPVTREEALKFEKDHWIVMESFAMCLTEARLGR